VAVSEGQPYRQACALPWLLAVALALAFAYFTHCHANERLIGFFRDDATYALAARALAHGYGYVDLSLPGLPLVNRYPPGFPALLATFVVGTRDIATEAARLLWFTPLAGGLFLVGCFAYFKQRAGFGAWWSLALATLVVYQQAFVAAGTLIIAELPFAGLCLLSIWGLEVALAKRVSRPAVWLCLGLLSSFACLVRTAGLGIIVSAVVVLCLARVFKPLGWYLLGLGLLLVPWYGVQQLAGAGDYASSLAQRLPQTATLASAALGKILLTLFGNAVPAVFAGGAFPAAQQGGLVASLCGLMLALLPLAGAVSRLRRPFDAARVLPAIFVLVTLAVSGAYAMGYAFYAGLFLQRALLPIAPFIVLLAVDGARPLLRVQEGNVVRAIGASALCLALSANFYGVKTSLDAASLPGSQPEIAGMLAFVRESLPDQDVLFGPYSGMAAYYTGHPCVQFMEVPQTANGIPDEAPASFNILLMNQMDVRYLIGMPSYVAGDPADRTMAVVQALQKAAPGLLHTVYISPSRKVAVFGVDPLVLQLYARQVKSALKHAAAQPVAP
jgi:hypothetical protein